MNKRIAVFDFDGTITTKDTFPEFIRYTAGNLSFFTGFLHFLPQLVAYKVHIYPNWKVKEKIFAHFFQGMTERRFEALCQSFFQAKGKKILKKEACVAIQKHKDQGDTVLIVSANIRNWIVPFGKFLGVHGIISTEVAVDSSNCLTGKFSTPNCYGKEKVNRIKQMYPDYGDYTWIAYGDSGGDKEMLDFADERHYRTFFCPSRITKL